MNGISKETFAGYDTDGKLNTLFDLLHNVYNGQEAQRLSHDDLKAKVEKQLIIGETCMDDHNKRLGKLETRKKYDSGISAAMGFIGGALAHMAQKFMS